MPIEIRELVIKAEISAADKQASAESAPDVSGRAQEDLIEECVREVLSILDKRQER